MLFLYIDGVELRKSLIPLLEWTANRNTNGKERCANCPPYICTSNQKNLGEKNESEKNS